MQDSAFRAQICLIVEDEPVIGLHLEELLDAEGYEPRWVASIEAALATINDNPPDVAIIDIRLRDTFCIELALELKRRGLPFIIHSGLLQKDSPLELTDIPWLSKPADQSSILSALDAVRRQSAEML